VYSITPQKFLDYTNQIKEIFPSQDPGVYYKPAIMKNRFDPKRKYRPPGGRLYDRYRNMFKKCRKFEQCVKENANESDIDTESKSKLTYCELCSSIYNNFKMLCVIKCVQLLNCFR